MFSRLRKFFHETVAWFRPETVFGWIRKPKPAPLIIALSPPPLTQPSVIEPSPAVEPKPSPAEPLYHEPKIKWLKPKGLEKLQSKKRGSSGMPRPARPRLKPEPVQTSENPEKWGQYYFRNAILDQLENYFLYLKRMRHHSRDAYELHRQLGIQVMPGSAVQAFDNWRSEGEMRELSAWWTAHRPSFGAVSYGIDHDSLQEESIRVVDAPPEAFKEWEKRTEKLRIPKHRIGTITGADDVVTADGVKYESGTLWVPKFLYFTKYKRPPPHVQQVADGDVYAMTVYWDRVDGHSKTWMKRHKGGVPQEYAVCIERGSGQVRVLRMLHREHVKIRHTHGKDRGRFFSIPNTHWGFPTEYLTWAVGRFEASPEDYLRRCFIEAALMYESATLGSMIRIEASKGDLTATFSVEIKRTSYFFKDRDVTAAALTSSGTRVPIFHIVRPHVRKSGVAVRMHFRGLREFDWAGYHIKITVPGRDHFHLAEFDVGGSTQVDMGVAVKGNKETGETLVNWMREGLGAWK